MCVWSPTTGGVRVPRGAQDARAGAGGRARPRHGSQQGTFREHSGNIQGTFASGFLQPRNTERVQLVFTHVHYTRPQVCGGPALSLFRYEELELLVCGLPHLDFAALQQVTRYEGGYSPTHPT
eukprot:953890-Pyramimonas_sp.AAC.1